MGSGTFGVRIFLTAVLSAGLCIASAVPAMAGTLTQAFSEVTYTANPGEVNNLTIVADAATERISDTAGIQAIPAAPVCSYDVPGDLTRVTCAAEGEGRTANVKIDLGDGNDRLVLRLAPNGILGGGRSRISDGPGNDTISGGAAADTWTNGPGNDVFYGNGGNDVVISHILRPGPGGANGYGNDREYGGTGNDRLEGGFGVDVLYGGLGNDSMVGGPGNDRMYGDAGNDTMYGVTNNDYMSGGPGNDVLWGGLGFDTMFGGFGFDRIDGVARDVHRG